MNHRLIILMLALTGLLLVTGCSSSTLTDAVNSVTDGGDQTSNSDASKNNSNSGPSVPDGENNGAIYVATTSDLSSNVTDAVKTTLELAKTEWGLDWNLDYYVVGDDKAAAQTFLEQTYCSRGLQQGRYDNDPSTQQIAGCLERNPKEKITIDGNQRFEGLMGYYQFSIDEGGSAARVGMAPMHVFMHSIPTGLANRNKNGAPAPADADLATVLHEFWHAVQAENTGPTNEDAIQPLMGSVWFVEGSAEYMGQYLRAKLRGAGTLPSVGNTAAFSFPTTMQTYANELKPSNNESQCTDRKLLSYQQQAYGNPDPCVGYGITLGTWAIAYLHSLPGVDHTSMATTLHPAVANDGWQKAFETTAGMTLTEFETQFHSWLDANLDTDSDTQAAMLGILPTF